MKNVHKWGPVLLLASGLLLGVPALSSFLSFGGAPWINYLVGWASVLTALYLMLMKK